MSGPHVLVPGAPVLVPALSGTASRETTGGVRRAVRMVAEAARGTDECVVLGVDAAHRSVGDVSADLRRWGPPVGVGGRRPAADDPDVPDAALLGWWFLDAAGVLGPRSFVPVGASAGAQPPSGDRESRVLTMVVADGPAALAPRAPIPEIDEALALDRALTGWLRDGGTPPDVGKAEADRLGWWSRPAWLALAELVGGRPAAEAHSWAPFGVGYRGARWEATE